MTASLETPLSSMPGVVNWFLKRSAEDNAPIDLIKLVKLTYLSHGRCLRRFNRPLVDELFEATEFGITNSSIHYEYKKHGVNPIPYSSFSLMSVSTIQNGKAVSFRPIASDSDILEEVWNEYKNMSSIDLSRMVNNSNKSNLHNIVYNASDRNGLRKVPIPNEVIRDYFVDNGDI